jgi:site-specific recombinase XerD
MPAINRGTYFEARFKTSPGKYRTIYDENGKPRRYPTKELAETACKEEEIVHRVLSTRAIIVAGPVETRSAPHTVAQMPERGVDRGELRFEDYVEEWLDDQDLADSTVAAYESHIQCHLLPLFGPMPLRDITRRTVADWEKSLRAAGYSAESINSYHAVLHVILEDAVEANKIPANPARRKRNRGRRVGRKSRRAPRKVITDTRGALLIAERMALLSGRDDEFVAMILKYFTGIRIGELIGLETTSVTRGRLRVEWQLSEVGGKLIRCEPKCGSYRDIDLPEFLWRMLDSFIVQSNPRPCECHGNTYVFRGQVKRRSRGSASGITQRDIAEHVGVTVSTVSAALRGCRNVSELSRQRVLRAANELGYTKPVVGEGAAHWRRSGFYAWLYTPAVSGWYPSRGKRAPARAVPVSATAFPGVPVRGSNAHARADACWMPIAKGMTPHGNRHSHRTLLEELGTPQKLINERIGHEDWSVQSRYTRVTDVMVKKLMADLTREWHEALDWRLKLCPTSPVAMLNRLLRLRAEELQHSQEVAA